MVSTATRCLRTIAVAAVCGGLVGLSACGSSNTPGANDGGDEIDGLKSCRRTCEEAADCGEQTDRWSCQNGYCLSETRFDEECSTDQQCWARFSGWEQTECEQSGCGSGRICIEMQGSDYCATQPRSDGCAIGSRYEAALADGSGQVTVCASQGFTCDAGLCREPCTGDDDCEGSRTCDEASGRCLCNQDSDCNGDLVCNQGTGDCVCRSDQHCSGQGADTCYDGTCGCGNDDSCSSFGDDYTCGAPPR